MAAVVIIARGHDVSHPFKTTGWGGVAALDAPEWLHVPETFRRADGESIYREHSRERYATRAQLSMNERLLADAQSEGTAHLARDRSAALPDADLGQLQARLYAGAAGG